MRTKPIRLDIEDYKTVEEEQKRYQKQGIYLTKSKTLKAIIQKIKGL